MKRSAGRQEARDRRAAFMAVAAKSKAFRPAHEVLSPVRAVPTRFVEFDHATGVGGLPTARFMLVHGPSSEGKTSLSLGFIDSFIRRAHFAKLIDAECTTPITWLEQWLGKDVAHSWQLSACRPRTYEEAAEEVDDWTETIAKARKEGAIDPDTTGIVVIDSLRKLVPQALFKKLLKDGAREDVGLDGMSGRGAQFKAAANSAWLDDLIPKLAERHIACLAIARETEDPNADQWARKYGNDYKVGGGKAVYYDSSLVMRCQRAEYVMKHRKAPEGQQNEMYGERIRVTIKKTKVHVKEDRQIVSYFHTSNGKFIPEGFDPARDVLELAQRFGIVTGTSWLSWGNQRLGQGEHRAVQALYERPEMLRELEAEVRSRFADHNPLEHTDDGEVLE